MPKGFYHTNGSVLHGDPGNRTGLVIEALDAIFYTVFVINCVQLHMVLDKVASARHLTILGAPYWAGTAKSLMIQLLLGFVLDSRADLSVPTHDTRFYPLQRSSVSQHYKSKDMAIAVCKPTILQVIKLHVSYI